MAQFSVSEVQNRSLGQEGAILVTGTTACTNARGVFVAIQFLEDTVFASGSGGARKADKDLYDKIKGKRSKKS